MIASRELDKLLPALAKVKAELKAVVKSSANPYFKSKYADLNSHLEEVEPLLEKNGMVLLQPPVVSADSSNIVETFIVHIESGQFVGSSMKLVGETDMQKAGSGVTYARRYTLKGLLAMKDTDDDAESTMNRPSKKSVAVSKSKGKSLPSEQDDF